MARKSAEKSNTGVVPSHIAVIMDGNGRWARRRGLPRLAGHSQGYVALKRLVQAASDMGIKAVTAYAFSSENWKRPQDEVSGLLKLIEFAAKSELEKMKKDGVHIVFSGRTEDLPESLQKQIREDTEETRGNSKLTLNIAINYGGRNEIIDAARRAAEMAKSGELEPDQIDEALLSGLMYHPELGDPDLLIRTAGEMRISNFLLWQTAYAEIYVTDTLWPDFDEEALRLAVESFQKRTRKFGTVVEEPAQ